MSIGNMCPNTDRDGTKELFTHTRAKMSSAEQ